ncbi:MAG: efflux RND transporter permease subunit [Bacteroidales bacterium]
MNIIQTSLKHKQVTLTVLIMVFAVGVYSLLTMPRREDPKITVPLGLVVAYYPGATVAQVEEQVTGKLEQTLFQFAEIDKDKTYSTSLDGISIINVCLNDNVKATDVFWNKLRHQLMLAGKTELPKGVLGPIVNSDFGDTEAMLIALESDNTSYTQLAEYSKILEDKLRQLPESAKIKRIGTQKEQITVYFDSQSLAMYNISLQQVAKVLQSQNLAGATGEIRNDDLSVSLHSTGNYSSITEIENQIVGTSRSGSVVRLGDIAKLKREYAEATTDVGVNGKRAIIVSTQMQEGNNIVKFGEAVSEKIKETKQLLPDDLELTVVVNQPQTVDENISHFLGEFLLAIISVIIVLLLLLPFRMAAIAATAIPATVAVTFAMLNGFGIELHQVSLAALIVVLGMIVDDAIVVADNYLSLLERGVDRSEAAWRSASDLFVPIVGATITIIASFMPLALLTGAIGEFIEDLPYTVTLAFTSSFMLSMVFTPILCYVFVKKTKRSALNEAGSKPKRKNLLDYMQSGYNTMIAWFVKHSFITVVFSIVSIFLAWLVYTTSVGQKFFPYAERNQFVIEVWTPTGTSLDKTKKAVAKLEVLIKDDERVTSYASFSGQSAPRVYYNFSPEFPVSNYGQILVNTTSNKSTEQLAHELENLVGNAVPEGIVQVKLMQQGQPLKSPVEIRIFGDDVNVLKRIGNDVKEIVKSEQGSIFVSQDFKEDYFGMSIKLKSEANRLGFTTNSIAQALYTNISGYPVSTIYEGDNAVNIVLRLDEKKRSSYEDTENIFLESPATGESVALRQVAELVPQWYPGRIMHRNGVRCLTVSSETSDGVLPAELLAAVSPQIENMLLPSGYHIEYGGEHANKDEVFGRILHVLGISIALIFIILLIQFKNLKELFIVMLSIPLALFGAVAGLAITGNNFGFTAFVGIISLSGIVVRNAIILIEQIRDLTKEGWSIKEAAIESGKRRLRPIFLTTMSTSLGLLPMILSGSSLWSPLASVIAFGVLWSMVMSLITVPVLYTRMIK